MNFWQQIPRPIVGLAPMDGITDYPMRQIQVQVGKPDVIFSEFVNVEGFLRNPTAFEKRLAFAKNELPIVAQVYGSSPKDFYLAVKKITKLGFSGIDINMGCPARKVVDRKSGGGLIGKKILAGKIIENCLKAIFDSGKNLPLSVKTRIGKKTSEVEDWIGFLSQFPLSLVTVHGRALKDRHSGPVDWQEVEKAASILRGEKILCLGNGGVNSFSSAKKITKKYHLDGVLVGQAAWGNPWFFIDRKPKRQEILATIVDHAKKVEDFYDQKGFVTIRKHLARYVKGFPKAKQLKEKLLSTTSFSQVKKVIVDYDKLQLDEGKV